MVSRNFDFVCYNLNLLVFLFFFIKKNIYLFAAKIHIDVYTAMTGTSRFGQIRNDWIYSKNESHSSPSDYMDYTHLLTQTPQYHESYFEIIYVVNGYERLKLKRPKEFVHNLLVDFFSYLRNDDENVNLWLSLLPVHIVTEPKIWIMKRIHFKLE